MAYGSPSMSAEQTRHCINRKDLLTVFRFSRMYRHYLFGRKFIIRTDHYNPFWCLNFKYPEDQLARWFEELGQNDLVFRPRPGRRHVNADALSRPPTQSRCRGLISPLTSVICLLVAALSLLEPTSPGLIFRVKLTMCPSG